MLLQVLGLSLTIAGLDCSVVKVCAIHASLSQQAANCGPKLSQAYFAEKPEEIREELMDLIAT